MQSHGINGDDFIAAVKEKGNQTFFLHLGEEQMGVFDKKKGVKWCVLFGLQNWTLKFNLKVYNKSSHSHIKKLFSLDKSPIHTYIS